MRHCKSYAVSNPQLEYFKRVIELFERHHFTPPQRTPRPQNRDPVKQFFTKIYLRPLYLVSNSHANHQRPPPKNVLPLIKSSQGF